MQLAAIMPSIFALRRPPRLPYRRLTIFAVKAPMAPPIQNIATVVLHRRVSAYCDSVNPRR